MKLLTILFAVNATLLLLHEIESAYEKEWEIFKLQVKSKKKEEAAAITGFLIFHIPIILLFFYGLLEIDKQSFAGLILGIITGVGGLIPFLVHKIAIKREDRFNLAISNVVIYLNIIFGIALIILSVSLII
jgi:hypothetical protein